MNKKVHDGIIDNGSSENVVSRTLVKAMGLSLQKHPQSYKVGWIRKGLENMCLSFAKCLL